LEVARLTQREKDLLEEQTQNKQEIDRLTQRENDLLMQLNQEKASAGVLKQQCRDRETRLGQVEQEKKTLEQQLQQVKAATPIQATTSTPKNQDSKPDSKFQHIIKTYKAMVDIEDENRREAERQKDAMESERDNAIAQLEALKQGEDTKTQELQGAKRTQNALHKMLHDVTRRTASQKVMASIVEERMTTLIERVQHIKNGVIHQNHQERIEEVVKEMHESQASELEQLTTTA
jgi:hypothetical protein